MNPIVQAPGGTYVDLSKIVAISKIYEGPYSLYYGQKLDISYIFDIHFIALGVPFKQDCETKIKITSDIYTVSDEDTFITKQLSPRHDIYSGFASEEQKIKYYNKIEESKKDWDTKREELVAMWKQYKEEFKV